MAAVWEGWARMDGRRVDARSSGGAVRGESGIGQGVTCMRCLLCVKLK